MAALVLGEIEISRTDDWIKTKLSLTTPPENAMMVMLMLILMMPLMMVMPMTQWILRVPMWSKARRCTLIRQRRSSCRSVQE
jgi:hypothetical protein